MCELERVCGFVEALSDNSLFLLQVINCHGVLAFIDDHRFVFVTRDKFHSIWLGWGGVGGWGGGGLFGV